MGPASYRSMDETALLGVGGFPPRGTVVVIELIGCVCVCVKVCYWKRPLGLV